MSELFCTVLQLSKFAQFYNFLRLCRVIKQSVVFSSTNHIKMSSFFYCRYMNGASTNPDAHVVAYAGAQVKKGLDIAKKLGAENFGM